MKRALPRKLVRLIPVLCLLITGISATVITVALRVHAAVGSNTALSVFVGYAEDKETNNPNPANFPVPWAGAPNTTFLGSPVPGQAACGTLTICYDTGAIRLDNSGTTNIVVSNVTVGIHANMTGGKTFSLWGSFTVPAGKSVILAANPPTNNPNYDNFDTSGYPSNNCTPISQPPTVALTINGVTTTLLDTAHVLDTDGIDLGYCKGNESIQWHAIGVAGVHNATISLYPANANLTVGHSVTETAFLQDGSGGPLPNAPVKFTVTSGPDAGKTASGYTNASGHASFTYTNTAGGADTVFAAVTSVGTFQTQTNVFWGPQPPPAWTGADIGKPALAGSNSVNNGVWTVAGEGNAIGGTADQFHLVSQPLISDGSVSAQVMSQTNTNGLAQAGIMLRLSTNPSSPFYAVFVTPSKGIFVFDRTLQGERASAIATIATGVAPVYLKVSRNGNDFSAYTSSDGLTWKLITGSAVPLPALAGTLLGGMAVSSNTVATPTLDTATFKSVNIHLSWSSADIGSPALAGSDSTNNGVWTISGSGVNIGGTSDQFHFVWRPLVSNGGIRARVLNQSLTSTANAKAGVMLRLNTTAGSPFYTVVVTPGIGILVRDRVSQGGVANTLVTIANGTMPVYLQVERSGNTFTAYTSSNGINWTAIAGSSVSISALTGTLLASMAVTSYNTTQINTATFDNVSTP